MTPQLQVADFIAGKRNSFAAFAIGLTVTTEPIFNHLKSFFKRDLHTAVLSSRIRPSLTIGEQDENSLGKVFGGYQLNILDSIRYLDRNNAVRMEFLSTITVGMVLNIGDALKKHDYFTKAPELEFLRHLRNGIAHGNQFDIRPGTRYPWRVAAFAGMEIIPAMNGTKVLDHFVAVGDVLILFDLIEKNLRYGAYG